MLHRTHQLLGALLDDPVVLNHDNKPILRLCENLDRLFTTTIVCSLSLLSQIMTGPTNALLYNIGLSLIIIILGIGVGEIGYSNFTWNMPRLFAFFISYAPFFISFIRSSLGISLISFHMINFTILGIQIIRLIGNIHNTNLTGLFQVITYNGLSLTLMIIHMILYIILYKTTHFFIIISVLILALSFFEVVVIKMIVNPCKLNSPKGASFHIDKWHEAYNNDTTEF